MKTRIAIMASLIAVLLGVTLHTRAYAEKPDSSAKKVRAIQADLKSTEADVRRRQGEVVAIVTNLLNELNLPADKRILKEGEVKSKLNDLISAAQRQGAIQQELKEVGTL